MIWVPITYADIIQIKLQENHDQKQNHIYYLIMFNYVLFIYKF